MFVCVTDEEQKKKKKKRKFLNFGKSIKSKLRRHIYKEKRASA